MRMVTLDMLTSNVDALVAIGREYANIIGYPRLMG